MERKNEHNNARRKFLLATCAGACGLIGGVTLLSLLDSCKTTKPAATAEVKNGRVSLPLTAFAEAKYRLVQPLNAEYDIIIIKKPDGEYNAFQMRCTHRNARLNASPEGMHCPQHGSNFDMDGNVTKGPAGTPLTKYKTLVENGNVIVLTS